VDRGSKKTLASAIEAAQRADTLVYSILFAQEQESGGGSGGGGMGHHGGMGGGGWEAAWVEWGAEWAAMAVEEVIHTPGIAP